MLTTLTVYKEVNLVSKGGCVIHTYLNANY